MPPHHDPPARIKQIDIRRQEVQTPEIENTSNFRPDSQAFNHAQYRRLDQLGQTHSQDYDAPSLPPTNVVPAVSQNFSSNSRTIQLVAKIVK